MHFADQLFPSIPEPIKPKRFGLTMERSLLIVLLYIGPLGIHTARTIYRFIICR